MAKSAIYFVLFLLASNIGFAEHGIFPNLGNGRLLNFGVIDKIENLRAQAYVASGYKAKTICSALFVGKRSEKSVIREEFQGVDPQLNKIEWSVDYRNKCVTTQVMPLRKIYRTACFKENYGCTLVDYGMKDNRPASALVDKCPDSGKKDWLESTGWDKGPGPTDEPTFDSDALDSVTNKILNKADINTRGLVVVHKDKIISEKYAPTFTKDSKMLGWSMAKSVTGLMAGVLNQQGKLSLEDSNLFQAWQKDKRSQIKVKDLMTMTSGLQFNEDYDNLFADSQQMLFTEPHMGAFSLNKPRIAEPGKRWEYSSGTSNILQSVIRNQFPTQEEYLKFPHKELFCKIGIKNAVFETDAAGNYVGSSSLHVTARDWARLGLLMLHNGKWGDEQLISKNWIDFMKQAAPNAPNGKYGGQVWTNHGDANGNNKPWPKLPSDTFVMIGYDGQSVIIVPSKDLVITRFGHTKPETKWNINDATDEIIGTLK